MTQNKPDYPHFPESTIFLNHVKYTFFPAVIPEKLGDGKQLVWLRLNYHNPLFYIVAIDSSIDINDLCSKGTFDQSELLDQSDWTDWACMQAEAFFPWHGPDELTVYPYCHDEISIHGYSWDLYEPTPEEQVILDEIFSKKWTVN